MSAAAAARKLVFGVIAEFPSAAALYEAAEKVRDQGFKFWDVHSPFPIHGMNKAMSLGKSPLGYIIFWGGFTGFLTAVLLEYNPFFFSLSVDRARETGKLFHGPGLFPDYVRTDRVALGFHGFFRSIRVESAAAAAPSTLRSRTFHAGNK